MTELNKEYRVRRRKLSAGDIIEARCTKCRAVTNHRIVAMVEEKVVRVECNTCSGIHNYYPPGESRKTTSSASVTRKKEAVPRKTASAKGSAELEEWEAICAGIESGSAIPYDINGKFQVNALIEHPVFGIGVVKAVIRPNKMEVVFRDGKKMLRCSA